MFYFIQLNCSIRDNILIEYLLGFLLGFSLQLFILLLLFTSGLFFKFIDYMRQGLILYYCNYLQIAHLLGKRAHYFAIRGMEIMPLLFLVYSWLTFVHSEGIHVFFVNLGWSRFVKGLVLFLFFRGFVLLLPILIHLLPDSSISF